ncbi:MAG TPA: ABC transporter substrate-binding protein [Burkholderiaceae bacterium]|nr:ABC transporter substrate-binding protein [Burkholderiaceae bacterium]
MKLKKISAACAIAATALMGASAHAQVSNDVIKIGFITNMSGVYADLDGPGGVAAIKMAIADMGGEINGKKVELLVADHQNKPDIGAVKAREWFDTEGLDMLIGGTTSSVNLAMAKVAAEKHKPFLAVGPGTSALTNAQCSPYTVHYAYDTVALAKGTGGAVVKAGGKSWFFITADYAFGHALQKDTTKVVEAAGGKVLGAVKVPLAASDFSSYMLQALASKAQILGLANAGGDTVNSIKAANAFGVTKKMKLAGLLMFLPDVHSLGLEATQGMYLTDSWYWNRDDETRAWAKRFFEERKSMPGSLHAADYSVTQTYLKAVKATGTDDGDKVLAYMHKTKINDMYAKDGYIRPDGRMVHDMYLMQVKTPAQSKGEWDLFNVVSTIKGEDAFTTKAESTCKLWK